MKNVLALLATRLHGDRATNPEEDKEKIFGFF
jgi:hypothetical protein